MTEMLPEDYSCAYIAAAKYSNYSFYTGCIDFDDLYAEALKGVFNASRSFDPTKSSRKTWMVCCAKREIIKYLRDHSRTVRVPRNVKDAPYSSVSVDNSKKDTRLNASSPGVVSEVGDVLAAITPDCYKEDPADLTALLDLEIILGQLPNREAYILTSSASGKTYVEIGEELGICKERVRQLKNSAMTKAMEFVKCEI